MLAVAGTTAAAEAMAAAVTTAVAAAVMVLLVEPGLESDEEVAPADDGLVRLIYCCLPCSGLFLANASCQRGVVSERCVCLCVYACVRGIMSDSTVLASLQYGCGKKG